MGTFKALNRTVEPQSEPITVSDVKEHLRLEGNDFDNKFTNLILEARDYVQDMVGRAFVTQTYELKMDRFYTDIKVPMPPLQSVSSIQYQDSNNATQTLAASNYTVDTDREPGRIVQSSTGSFPSTYPDLNAVTITFIAGYGDRETVPEVFKRSMYLYIELMHDMPSGTYGVALERALSMMLEHNRINYLSLE